MFGIYEDPTKPKSDRTSALAHLVSRLYHHRLFPVWPSFTRADVRSARSVPRIVLLRETISQALLGYFLFSLAKKRDEGRIAGDILDRVRCELSPMLDPALAEGGLVLLETSGAPVKVRDVEDLFSVSVFEGKTRTRYQLQSLEYVFWKNSRLSTQLSTQKTFLAHVAGMFIC